MKKLLMMACLCATAAQARGDGDRWVTFKTGHDSSYGVVQHQIDRDSIRREGPYRTFSIREWIVEKKQPMTYTINDRLFFVSRKFAVDCAHRRFGDRFIDSQNAREKATSLNRMHWTALDKVPAVDRMVCQ
jgi:hypothetical protein